MSLLAACSSQAQPTIRADVDYVALGDSAASGPRIPEQTGTPGCEQSDANYPHVIAAAISAKSFVDVSCGGAQSADIISESQTTSSGQVPPQIDALSAETDLVTISIGGNDVGLVSTAAGCIAFSPRAPLCRDRLTAGGVDSVAESIDETADTWGDVLDAIVDRAPNADVVVVGYGTYVQPGGCYPTQPILPDDADYIQGSIDRLDDALAAQAAAHGARFVDTREITVGHDACADPSERYFEGVIPVNPAAPFHPTAAGMNAIGRTVAESVTE